MIIDKEHVVYCLCYCLCVGFQKDGVHMLTKENMFLERILLSESEYDLAPFQQWWLDCFDGEGEEEMEKGELTPDMIKTIIARYVRVWILGAGVRVGGGGMHTSESVRAQPQLAP